MLINAGRKNTSVGKLCNAVNARVGIIKVEDFQINRFNLIYFIAEPIIL